MAHTIRDGWEENEKAMNDGVVAFGRVRLYLSHDSSNRLAVVGWRGKAKKPFANYHFRSIQEREHWITQLQESERKADEARERSKREQQAEREKFRQELRSGTMLYTSWGYDQTNTEFFQVVMVKGQTVTVREIAGEMIRGTGPFSADYRPKPGQFISKGIKRRIGPGYIRIDDVRNAYPTKGQRSFHRSSGH